MKDRFTHVGKPETGVDLSENAQIPAADEPKRQVSETDDVKTAVAISVGPEHHETWFSAASAIAFL
ncbi:MAG: hypothetical protein ACLP0B_21290 [Steroidobacteraceae bacterium]